MDKLYFRSEKQFSGGHVVMEIHFDRAKPDDDKFEVSVCDKAGNVLRQETYSREEVMQTYRDLSDGANPNGLVKAATEADRKDRINRVHELFPEIVPSVK